MPPGGGLRVGLLLLGSVGCYQPPDLPPFRGVPIEAVAPTCRDEEEGVYVACTIDGDTLDLGVCGDGGERVRMLGVDAPETEKPGVPADCYADEAWAWLDALVAYDDIAVSFDRTCVDIYDRTLAYVWLVGNEAEDAVDADHNLEPYLREWILDDTEPAILVNEVMLGEGFAYQYPEEIAGTLIFQDQLDAAAASAERNARGAWGACGGG